MAEVETADLTAAMMGETATAQRIARILSAKDDIEQKQAALAAQRDEIDKRLDEVRQTMQQAHDLGVETQGRAQSLDELQARLAATNEELVKEKTAFNEARSRIDADHAAREAAIKDNEARLAVLSKALTIKAAALTDREGTVTEREAAHAARVARLQEAWDGPAPAEPTS